MLVRFCFHKPNDYTIEAKKRKTENGSRRSRKSEARSQKGRQKPEGRTNGLFYSDFWLLASGFFLQRPWLSR
jgi:hypothetical protein